MTQSYALPPAVRELYPFDSHSLLVGGVRYHYLDEGEGKPVLMVHGNPTWSFLYRNLLRSLSSSGFRCLAVDHVGCGLSEKPQDYRYRLARHIGNLEEFVLRMDLQDATLIVHDWGGPIGLGVAGRHPERFSRIVVSNTAAYRSQRLPRLLKVARLPLFGEVVIRGLNAFALTFRYTGLEKKHLMQGPIGQGYIWPYDSWANRIATARFVQDIPMNPAHPSWVDLVEVERNLPRLREKPIMLLWGERDWCFSPHFRDRFLEFFPEAKTVNFPAAGHLVWEDEPDGTLQAVRDFLP